MSSGQKQRTPENFPRMKDRAVGRRARKVQREAFYTLYSDPDFGRELGAMFDAWATALLPVRDAFARLVGTCAAIGSDMERRANPEDVVIDAINGLERDEIGAPWARREWTLPTPPTGARGISIAPAGILPPDLGGDPAAWQPFGEIPGVR